MELHSLFEHALIARLKQQVSNVCFISSAFLALSFAQTSTATQIQVRVIDPLDNTALSNASVCLGTPAQPDQFGAQRTDYQGLVSFEVATAVPALITVSANQHKGTQRAVSVGQTDILREINLPRGGLGPHCKAGPTRVAIKSPQKETPKLRLTGFTLDNDSPYTTNRFVVLNPIFIGHATHYRVSSDPQFKDAVWQPYKDPALFTLSKGNGQKKLYYQLREVQTVERGQVERISNVASDRIMFQLQ